MNKTCHAFGRANVLNAHFCPSIMVIIDRTMFFNHCMVSRDSKKTGDRLS